MQIVSGDITRDITGEIVYLKAYKQMVGEVTEYSTSKNTATVKLCDTGLEITVSLDDIESTGSTQPHRTFNSEVHILGGNCRGNGKWRYEIHYKGDPDGGTRKPS